MRTKAQRNRIWYAAALLIAVLVMAAGPTDVMAITEETIISDASSMSIGTSYSGKITASDA